MANSMSVNQVSAVLKEVIKQSTGVSNVGALDTAQLLTIGQKALTVAPESVMNAITQVMSKTIFSSRPYQRKFGSLQIDPIRYGNMVRKVCIIEDPDDVKDNPYLNLTDGQSIDQYKIRKPKALQLNFLGQQTYEVVKTLFDTQLDTCFNSLDEFNNFISMVLVDVNNKIEKIHEDTARATVAGFIAGKVKGDADNVIHLLTEYKAVTGKADLTDVTIYAPENFGDFMKWVYSRINEVSGLMTEYSVKYHKNLTEGNILRHTPRNLQKCYLYAPVFYQTTSRVLADTYHDNFLTLPGSEMVNFWQSIDTPDTIKLKSVNYLDADGSIKEDATEFTQAKVFGVIFDEEAMGYTPILERTKVSPYNAEGEYRNMFWKFNERSWIDFTENGVVFVLD